MQNGRKQLLAALIEDPNHHFSFVVKFVKAKAIMVVEQMECYHD